MQEDDSTVVYSSLGGFKETQMGHIFWNIKFNYKG